MSQHPRSSSPIGWFRDRRARRAQRKLEANKQRVVQRVELLGPQWHALDPNLADPDFLAIGPGGIFEVTICDHGRSKVMLAGEVVQVDGLRPPYVAKARRDAALASKCLSVVAGRQIPVVPVVAFMGTGEIVYYGRPPAGCVITTWRDLSKALESHGSRLSQPTIDKLAAIAERPETWTYFVNTEIMPDSDA